MKGKLFECRPVASLESCQISAMEVSYEIDDFFYLFIIFAKTPWYTCLINCAAVELNLLDILKNNAIISITILSLNILSWFKDTLNKKIRSHLVHRYSCSSCNATYYGKTYWHFFTRAAEHMGISNLTSKRVKNVKESAVSDHLLQCNCAIDFDHFNILASDTNSFRLLIKESLLIKRDKPVLNRTVKSFPWKLFD